jgi:hypothetical protein
VCWHVWEGIADGRREVHEDMGVDAIQERKAEVLDAASYGDGDAVLACMSNACLKSIMSFCCSFVPA